MASGTIHVARRFNFVHARGWDYTVPAEQDRRHAATRHNRAMGLGGERNRDRGCEGPAHLWNAAFAQMLDTRVRNLWWAGRGCKAYAPQDVERVEKEIRESLRRPESGMEQ